MTQLFVNNAKSTTSLAVAPTDITISVVSTSSFPTITGADYMLVTLQYQDLVEIVKVIAPGFSAGTLTLGSTANRGQEGTAASSFPIGARVEGRFTAGSINLIRSTEASDVANETSRATSAENTLTTNLNSEVNRAKIAEALLAPIAGPTFTGITKLARGTSLTAASLVDLSTATGNTVHITGSTGPITSFGTVSPGTVFNIIFDSTPSVTYNVTTMIIPGGANVVVGTGDVWTVVSEGSGNWRVTSIEINSLIPSAASNGVPPGTVIDFAGGYAPAGYLQVPLVVTNVSRTTYVNLFNAIGTLWGVGDSSTTFGLPYLLADYVTVQGNANIGTATSGSVISHTHSGGNSSYTGCYSSSGCGGGNYAATVGSTGGAANLAAGVRVLKCIKY